MKYLMIAFAAVFAAIECGAITATKEYVDRRDGVVAAAATNYTDAAIAAVAGVTPQTVTNIANYRIDAEVADWARSGEPRPGGAVESVNGHTGTVVLAAADVGALSNSYYNTGKSIGWRFSGMPHSSRGLYLSGSMVITELLKVGVSGGSIIMGDNGTDATGNYSIAIGRGSAASGNYSAAFGNETTASEAYAMAVGEYSSASGRASFAAGGCAYSTDDYAFVWNGNDRVDYNSHGAGTISMNPVGGISGIYVGESNLSNAIVTVSGRDCGAKIADATNAVTKVLKVTQGDEAWEYNGTEAVQIDLAQGGGTDGAAVTNIVASIFPSNRVFGVSGGLLTAYDVSADGARTNEIWREARGYALTNGVEEISGGEFVGVVNPAIDGTITTITIGDAATAAAGVSVDLPSAWDAEARDFAVYVFNSSSTAAPLRLPTNATIYGYYSNATNALKANAATALYFTEISRNTFLLGRAELTKVQEAAQ